MQKYRNFNPFTTNSVYLCGQVTCLHSQFNKMLEMNIWGLHHLTYACLSQYLDCSESHSTNDENQGHFCIKTH
jgi:hypothetical protein